MIEKYRILSKTEKLFKSQKSAKLGKKLSKSRNLPYFNAKKNGPSFLIPNAKTVFNHLRLALTKAPILYYFDLKCHIWIEIDILGAIIGCMLSQLTFKTSLDGVITKTNLS